MNEHRGYDDNRHLEEMARGILDGLYSSVDSAARQVLGEPGGSNVDRLRRKFRKGGWFEKGRDAWLAEKIALAAPPAVTAASFTVDRTVASTGQSGWPMALSTMLLAAFLASVSWMPTASAGARLKDILPPQVPQSAYVLSEGTVVAKPACQSGGAPVLWVTEPKPSSKSASSQGFRDGATVEIVDRPGSWKTTATVTGSLGTTFCDYR